MPLLGAVQIGLGEAHHRVVRVIVVLGVAGEPDRGDDEKGPENVEDPGELFYRNRTQRDEDSAEDQCEDDPDEKCLLLIDLGHLEAGHDDDEDEQVVDGQAVLGEPSRVELQPVLITVEVPHPESETDRQADVDTQGDHALTPARLMGPAREHEDVHQQDGERHTEGDRPLERGDIHRADLRLGKDVATLPWAVQVSQVAEGRPSAP